MEFLPAWGGSRAEMVAFYYGAIFVFLGFLIISQRLPGTLPVLARLRLLAYFGLAYGASQWLVTAAFLNDLAWALAWPQLALEWLGWSCLLEFGRQTALLAFDREELIRESRGPLGPRVHVYLLVGMMLVLVVVGPTPAAAQLLMVYFQGIPAPMTAAGGFLAGALLLGEALRPSGTRPYFWLGALALGGMALLGAVQALEAVSGGPVAATGMVALRSLAAMVLVFSVSRIMTLTSDSQRRQVFAALERESSRSKMILDAAAEGILELDRRGVIQFANPAAASMLGTRPHQLVGRLYHAAIHHSRVDGTPNPPGKSPILQAIREGRIHQGNDQFFFRADGSSFSVEHACMPVMLKGKPRGAVLTFSDITERKRVDKLLRVTQGMAHIGGWELHPDTGSVSWTDEVYRIHELPLGTVLSQDLIKQFFRDNAHKVFCQALHDAIVLGRSFDLELKLATAADTEKFVRVIGQPFQKSGSGFSVAGTYQDVTERVLQQQKLIDNRDFYELILDSVPVRIAHIDNKLRVGYANRSYDEWFSRQAGGSPRRRLQGLKVEQIMSPEDYADARPRMERALRGEALSFQVSPVRNGQQYRLTVHYVPHISRTGKVLGFFSVVQDMTEYRQLEEKLVQAQKMEAVGQLTGGLAHDFNNLLGVILGNLQLLERPLRSDEKLHRKVKTATRAAMRGADLTRRLLAFSRRQILEPKVVDLHQLVDNLNELIRRTLGEGIDIVTEFPDFLWPTMVDPSQLETAILNLAINARDAMVHGGELGVEGENVTLGVARCREIGGIKPGDYVAITVRDTGCGMSPETLAQVFEPFFTTKEVGKGSGLGLSMVYGFAEQSGGGVVIRSEEGKGTSVTVYLPRADQLEPDALEETAIHRFMPGGDENILVVDDEDDVRETVVSLLHELGYKTLEAANGPDALEVVRQNGVIHMLLSDVRMPGGMHGPALAREVRKLRPDIKVMLTSGYAESETLRREDMVPGAEMLPKPYKNEELAIKMRLLLDRETADA